MKIQVPDFGSKIQERLGNQSSGEGTDFSIEGRRARTQ